MKELDHKTLQIVTSKQQADKAISSLKGILLGIKIDETINEKEINELKKWVSKHKELISRNPFTEFMTIIDETIKHNIPEKETIEDLFWLCQKYENDSYFFNGVTSDLQTLQGICHGILADGEINDQEVWDLNEWLKANEHLASYYPYDELRSIILSIVSDGIIDEEEKLVLKAYFTHFVKLHDDDIHKQVKNETSGILISGHCTSDPVVTFQEKIFCITGVLKRGSRESLQKEIIRLGGIITETISRKTDYLIVGDNGNPAWAFACYGRKVEKALSLRKEGHTIMLVHEFDFSDIIDDLN